MNTTIASLPIVGTKTADLPPGVADIWIESLDPLLRCNPEVWMGNTIVGVITEAVGVGTVRIRLELRDPSVYGLIKGRRVVSLDLQSNADETTTVAVLIPKPHKLKPVILPDPVDAPPPFIVYKLTNQYGVLLYVGITDRGMKRICEHERTKPWFNQVTGIEIERQPSLLAAAQRERHLIRKQAPVYNIQHNYGRHAQPATLIG